MKFEGWFNFTAETQLSSQSINFKLCLLEVRLHHISNWGLFWYRLLLIQDSILPQKHNSSWTIGKPPQNSLELQVMSIGGDIVSYIKYRIILITIYWGVNSRFNFVAETQLLVNHKQTTSKSIETLYSIYWG